jgi:hypothetical protein
MKKYKKPGKPCPRKRRNLTRVVNEKGTSPKVRWVSQRPIVKEALEKATSPTT